jgi:hypothetical protein
MARTLPEDGSIRIGAVTLTGRRIMVPGDEDTAAGPVAWVTDTVVPGAGLTWSELEAARDQTGLVPVLLADEEADAGYFFQYPSVDVSDVDELDAAAVLAARWSGRASLDDDEREASSRVTPYSREFPGLAPGQEAPLSDARLRQALVSLPAARIGLITAARPADVLPVAGWETFDDFLDSAHLPQGAVRPAAWIAAVLRSWEARFGARLMTIGPGARISLLAQRPPATPDAATQIAAEHFAFADECDGCGSAGTVTSIAKRLPGTPVWQFWWD